MERGGNSRRSERHRTGMPRGRSGGRCLHRIAATSSASRGRSSCIPIRPPRPHERKPHCPSVFAVSLGTRSASPSKNLIRTARLTLRLHAAAQLLRFGSLAAARAEYEANLCHGRAFVPGAGGLELFAPIPPTSRATCVPSASRPARRRCHLPARRPTGRAACSATRPPGPPHSQTSTTRSPSSATREANRCSPSENVSFPTIARA